MQWKVKLQKKYLQQNVCYAYMNYIFTFTSKFSIRNFRFDLSRIISLLVKRRDSRLEYSLPLLNDKRLVSVEQDVRDYRLRLNRNIETLTLYITHVLKCKYSIWLSI